KPATTAPDDAEPDKFRTPYTRWNKIAVGGVEIMATTFLNLVNDEWLRRLPWWVEGLVLVGTGVLLGGGLCQGGRLKSLWIGAGVALAVTLAAVWFSQITSFWFPWLVIAGGQVPCAIGFALLAPSIRRQTRGLPDAPDYELFEPSFAEGAYGK